MAIKVRCTCGRTLRARDEKAGKRIKCPECQQPVLVTAAGPPPRRKPRRRKSEADSETAGSDESSGFLPWYQRGPSVQAEGFVSKKPLAPGWDVAKRGLNLVFIGGFVGSMAMAAIMATVCAVAVMVLVFFLLAMAGMWGIMLAWTVGVSVVAVCAAIAYFTLEFADEKFPLVCGFFLGMIIAALLIWLTAFRAADWLLLLELVALQIGAVIVLIGWVLCAAIPAESRVQPFAIGSAALMFVTVGLFGYGEWRLMMAGLDAASSPGRPLDLGDTAHLRVAFGLAFVLAVLALYLFIFFLQGIPRFFGDQALLRDVNAYMVFHVILAAFGCSLDFLIASEVVEGGWALVLLATMLFLGLWSVTRFLTLVGACRDDIRPYFRDL